MAVKTTPEGYHSITPYLIVNDGAKAIEFYKKAFDARELIKPFVAPNGKVGHAELQIGDSPFMMADEFPDMGHSSPQTIGGTPVSLMVYVPDVDATFEQAVKVGASVMRPVQDQFYGDRSGQLKDPFGHVWTISTHKEDVSPEEAHRRAEKLYGEKHA